MTTLTVPDDYRYKFYSKKTKQELIKEIIISEDLKSRSDELFQSYKSRYYLAKQENRNYHNSIFFKLYLKYERFKQRINCSRYNNWGVSKIKRCITNAGKYILNKFNYKNKDASKNREND